MTSVKFLSGDYFHYSPKLDLSKRPSSNGSDRNLVHEVATSRLSQPPALQTTSVPKTTYRNIFAAVSAGILVPACVSLISLLYLNLTAGAFLTLKLLGLTALATSIGTGGAAAIIYGALAIVIIGSALALHYCSKNDSPQDAPAIQDARTPAQKKKELDTCWKTHEDILNSICERKSSYSSQELNNNIQNILYLLSQETNECTKNELMACLGSHLFTEHLNHLQSENKQKNVLDFLVEGTKNKSHEMERITSFLKYLEDSDKDEDFKEIALIVFIAQEAKISLPKTNK